eukprot:CAMPEP_0175125944 /NCGR_PEP_ID=MMETSP0087-20121206/3581_1 /TAXON_ID=136419 /ORGANISM="Unknown Unknown, Strain D1" /LENGTH=463 /DNA_ID=CAMNT_0016407805 /DNA_START=34 /DNA_END=1422 /DNA_ORIENTATION=-
MPRELITVQVGQCGMQLGTKFWDLALREHASFCESSNSANYDEAMSSFFRNVDSKENTELPVGNGKGKIRSLKARAVLIDMEEGVINEVLRSSLGSLFDTNQIIQDVMGSGSGSGNNWAHGHEVYGPKYADSILEQMRRTAEDCDSLQSFFLLHSLGGGTGSGLGTYVLELLQDSFPEVYRFTTCVFPSEDDDVVTSPYNSVLSLAKLIEHADCVLPIHNQSLIDICNKIYEPSQGRGKKLENQLISEKKSKSKAKAFDDMNTLGAHLLCNLTCSMRFPGTLNVDLNEITMNLVPFPNLHFLIPSLSPLYTLKAGLAQQPRSIDHMFSDAFDKDHQLVKLNPMSDTYLACSLMLRGSVQMSDITRNIERMKPKLKLAHWNEDCFKIGLCSLPPVGQKFSLSLANNCCIKDTFCDIKARFNRLYKRKAHLHHYTEYVEEGYFQESVRQIDSVVSEYSAVQRAKP